MYEYLIIGMIVNLVFLTYSTVVGRFSYFDLIGLIILIPIWPITLTGLILVHFKAL